MSSILDLLKADNSDIIEQQPFVQPCAMGKNTGIFISTDNVQAVDFTPDKRWKKHTMIFRSGESNEGFICAAPRFVVVGNTELAMFNRSTKRYIAPFDSSVYNRDNMECKTKYALIFLSDDNQPLHDNVLYFTPKGTVGLAFNKQLTAHRKAFCRLLDGKLRGRKFFKNIVTSIRFEQKEVGTKPNSAMVAYATDFEEITVDNVEQNVITEKVQPLLLARIEDAFRDNENLTFKNSTQTEEGYAEIGTASPVQPTLSKRGAEVLASLQALTDATEDTEDVYVFPNGEDDDFPF